MILPKMQNFPAIMLDGFYEDPDAVREFALAQEYVNDSDSIGYYPGIRTKPLHELNPELFNMFAKRFFSLFYDIDDGRTVNWTVYSAFHKIPLLDKDPNSLKNRGWVHVDGCITAGVIYLNKNADPNSGTSVFAFKEGLTHATFKDRFDPIEDTKMALFKSKTPQELANRTEEEDKSFMDAVQINNDMFIETARFQNAYNRLVSYDGTQFHAANGYESNEEFRLTQVFFVHEVHSYGSPIQRVERQK
jgi:hypothetical protein